MESALCPCCGNPIFDLSETKFCDRTLISGTHVVRFTKNQTVVLDLLWSKRPNVVTKQSIWNSLYALDPNGGPDPKVIDVMIYHIRKKLAPAGLEIVTVWGRGFVLRTRIAPEHVLSQKEMVAP